MIIVNFYGKDSIVNAYELLRHISFFKDLDGDALEALAKKARIKTFAANEQVVSQSERIKAFFIVISGRVKIFRSNAEGKEQILYLVEDGQPDVDRAPVYPDARNLNVADVLHDGGQ